MNSLGSWTDLGRRTLANQSSPQQHNSPQTGSRVGDQDQTNGSVHLNPRFLVNRDSQQELIDNIQNGQRPMTNPLQQWLSSDLALNEQALSNSHAGAPLVEV
ncbi:hypothetical protein DdX_04631 [Ditylenchus destructor]|uniref:Uncharacterized protein n=1 Tax=Ditylenchus destructor TaxID=166010 RepID=A0AAD4NA80_9BILA|nr:hypothetical protein DdX_04631 [Ditylenchus destructor]